MSQLDQPGEAGLRARRGGREFAAVFAQLGLDVGQAEQGIYLSLARARRRLVGGIASNPVLGYVQAGAHGCFAQSRVVLARAGEVLQQVAELARLGDAQVDAHARVAATPGARLACGGDLLDLGQRGEALRERHGLARYRDQIDVLHAVGHAPGRTGDTPPCRPHRPPSSPRQAPAPARAPAATAAARRPARLAQRPYDPTTPARSPRTSGRGPSPCAACPPRPPRARPRVSRYRAPSAAGARAWGPPPAAA